MLGSGVKRAVHRASPWQYTAHTYCSLQQVGNAFGQSWQGSLPPPQTNGYKGGSSIPNGTYIVLYTAVTCRSSGPMVYREWGGSTGRGAGEGCQDACEKLMRWDSAVLPSNPCPVLVAC